MFLLRGFENHTLRAHGCIFVYKHSICPSVGAIICLCGQQNVLLHECLWFNVTIQHANLFIWDVFPIACLVLSRVYSLSVCFSFLIGCFSSLHCVDWCWFTNIGLSFCSHRLAYENVKDIIAVGFDLKKTFIFSDLDYIQVKLHFRANCCFLDRLLWFIAVNSFDR